MVEDDGTARAGHYCKLHLKVVAHTKHGESIRVSGSSFVMGKNSPDEALPLVTTPEDYPVWSTPKPIIIPRGVSHSYNYALFSGGEIECWESIPPRAIAPESLELHMTEEFGTSPSGTDAPKPPLLDKVANDASANSLEEFSAAAAAAKGGSLAKLMEERFLVLVCFHLPIVLSKDSQGEWEASWNDSLIAKSENSVSDDIQTMWIGSVHASIPIDDLSSEEKEKIRTVLSKMNCIPVFASSDIVNRAYLGYCKQILWPSFHNVDILDLSHSTWNASGTGPKTRPEATWDQASTMNYWQAYVELNELFAAEVNALTTSREQQAVIWVHDYHLMLLPRLIHTFETADEGLPDSPTSPHDGSMPGLSSIGKERSSKIIFFLHIPFSTSQIYRSLQHGEELLLGMLSADVIGFHAFDHARHFLNACKRNLGLKFQNRSGGLLGIEFKGRTVMVVMRHVSIETGKVERLLEENSTQAAAAALEAKHHGKRVVAGLDTCQRLSGVALKLLAFEELLKEVPKYRSSVVLVQRVYRPKNRLEDEDYTSRELQHLVKRINDTFGPVVDYAEVHGSRLADAERLGMWKASDILLNTTVREGLNLDCLEFVFAQSPEDPGVIVASEFSSTVSVLNGAIRINPFDVEKVAQTLDAALSMGLQERQGRSQRDLPYVTSRPSYMWTKQILNDMLTVSQNNDSDVTVVDLEVTARTPTRQYSTNSAFSLMDPHLVMDAYRKTNRRILVFDYGGTLREQERLAKYFKDDINPCHKGRQLPSSMIAALQRLSEDPNNTVWIISGLARKSLEEAFTELPRVGLVAQNGLCDSSPDDTAPTDAAASRARNVSSMQSSRTWFVHDYGVNWDQVKSIAMPILTRYTGRTNGSSIRNRDPSIAWSYYRTDPEWGIMQATRLKAELEAALSPFNVQILHDRGELEIVPKLLHKGVAVKRILRWHEERGDSPTHEGKEPFDFILVMGDDASDEKMFSSVLSHVADLPPSATVEQRMFLCTVGKKPSLAGCYVEDVAQVEATLQFLGTSAAAAF